MAGYLAACCVAALSQLDWLLLVVVAAAAAVVVVVVVDDVGTTLSIAVNCAWRSSFVFWLLSSAGTGEGVAPYETSGVCVCVRGILYGCFRAWGAAGPLISSLASWRPHSLQDAYQLAPVTSKKPGEKTHTHTHTHTHTGAVPLGTKGGGGREGGGQQGAGVAILGPLTCYTDALTVAGG